MTKFLKIEDKGMLKLKNINYIESIFTFFEYDSTRNYSVYITMSGSDCSLLKSDFKEVEDAKQYIEKLIKEVIEI